MSTLKRVTQEELDDILAKHELWLADMRTGEMADFKRMDLRGFSLEEAELKYANFYQADLTEVNFKDVKVEGANFYATTLSDTSFEGAIFINGWKITRDVEENQK